LSSALAASKPRAASIHASAWRGVSRKNTSNALLALVDGWIMRISLIEHAEKSVRRAPREP
jgi:hypothetical protein